MHRHASSILLLNWLRNYLKAIKKTFVRHALARLIYIGHLIFHYKQKVTSKNIIILRIPKIVNIYIFFFTVYKNGKTNLI